jgi:hypothetical protein
MPSPSQKRLSKQISFEAAGARSNKCKKRRCGSKHAGALREPIRCTSRAKARRHRNLPTFTPKGGHLGAPATSESHKPATMALFLANILQSVHLLRQLTLATIHPLCFARLCQCRRLVSLSSSFGCCSLNCSAFSFCRGPCPVLSFENRFCFKYTHPAIPRSLNTSYLQPYTLPWTLRPSVLSRHCLRMLTAYSRFTYSHTC